MKRITRKQLRGKALDPLCKKAHTTTNEYGLEDKRVYAACGMAKRTENEARSREGRVMASFFDGYGGYCTCTREKCTDDCATYRRFKPKPITNYDRIRAMTDEELAAFLTNCFCELLNCESPCDGHCDSRMLDWLRQEASA